MSNDIITAQEVLELFDNRITYRVLLNLIRAKKIPACKAGKCYLFSKSAVEACIQKLLGSAKF